MIHIVKEKEKKKKKRKKRKGKKEKEKNYRVKERITHFLTAISGVEIGIS